MFTKIPSGKIIRRYELFDMNRSFMLANNIRYKKHIDPGIKDICVMNHNFNIFISILLASKLFVGHISQQLFRNVSGSQTFPSHKNIYKCIGEICYCTVRSTYTCINYSFGTTLSNTFKQCVYFKSTVYWEFSVQKIIEIAV